MVCVHLTRCNTIISHLPSTTQNQQNTQRVFRVKPNSSMLQRARTRKTHSPTNSCWAEIHRFQYSNSKSNYGIFTHIRHVSSMHILITSLRRPLPPSSYSMHIRHTCCNHIRTTSLRRPLPPSSYSMHIHHTCCNHIRTTSLRRPLPPSFYIMN